MIHLLAEIPYPRIDPILLELGDIKVRWYGVSYIIAFVAAGFVLHGLSRRGRWPVEPAKVVDVLFWGILGVFLGGRLGYFFFYGLSLNYEWHQIWRVWEGGMSFHGGLLGVIVAYWIYCKRTRTPLGEMFDGLSLAATPALFIVRMGNFINAELYGRVWDGVWAMRFPEYDKFKGPRGWEEALAKTPDRPELYTELRHPSQLYEAFAEGILLYLVLRWLMLRKGIGGGRIAGAFLIGYGGLRFFIEFARQPDVGIDFVFLDVFTRGQQLCFGMIVAGLIVLWFSRKNPNPGPNPPPAGPASATPMEPAGE